MKLIHLLFVVVFCFYGCKDQSNDLNIPDQVDPVRDTSCRQFPGTRVFVKPPKGYRLVPQLIRFQKNDATYFQVFEFPSANFDPQKLKEQLAEKRNSGKLDKEYYQKEFRFGNYNAILVYGPDNKPNTDQMVLCFGDNSFVVMVTGELPTGDRFARDEILRSLLTIYVDASVVADASVLATYSLDVANTEFEYAGNMSQTYIYNLGGVKLKYDDEVANQIMVSTLPAQEHKALKEFSISMINRYKSSGMEIPDYTGRETTLNGNYAYEIDFAGIYKGRPFSAYQVVTTNANSAVMLTGNAYDRRDELMTQIKKIAATLRPL